LGSRQREREREKERERERESTYIAQHIYKKMANETMRVFIFAQTREKESARERETLPIYIQQNPIFLITNST